MLGESIRDRDVQAQRLLGSSILKQKLFSCKNILKMSLTTLPLPPNSAYFAVAVAQGQLLGDLLTFPGAVEIPY